MILEHVMCLVVGGGCGHRLNFQCSSENPMSTCNLAYEAMSETWIDATLWIRAHLADLSRA